ncbi:helix-turn-helix domain-containing protein [Cohnella yongneupensis]|uniref:Helix-turn-helix domain-containing protein n=1 Tax=Cohnella yongneupensis TaxID=425006 RepID=A0ABW0R2S2_9BACL
MKIVLKDPKRFEEMLAKNGYSKRSFARTAHIAVATLLHISNCSRNPSARSAMRISRGLEVPFDEIFEIRYGEGGRSE